MKMLPFAELKQANETITRAIGKADEPKAELLAVARFLNEMCAHDAIALEPREELEKDAEGKDTEATVDEKQPFNKAQLRYILEDMSPGLVKRMCRERSNDPSVSHVQIRFLSIYSILHLILLRSAS